MSERGPQIPGVQERTAKIRRTVSSLPGKPRTSAASRPPSGLSRRHQAFWVDLHEVNDFAPHEDDQLEHSLKWYDVADRLLREAGKLRGRERSARLKSAGDAATVALRFWRTLKFVDPARPARRPGRPPGGGWATVRAADVAQMRRLSDADR